MRALVAVALILAGCTGHPQPQPAGPGPSEALTVHLTCMGTGAPTVILTPGLGGSAADWQKVQPQLARTTRVCAWDRPGAGASPKSTGQETVADTTAAVLAALKANRIRGPYIVVGHSLGAYETLLLKDRAPDAVVGMVLVDPSIPGQVDRLARVAPKPPVADKPLADPLTISSRLVVDPRRHYRAMPLIVLTSTRLPDLPPDLPESARAEFAALNAEMHRGHAELAALSSRGAHRRVPDSGHYIQSDQPDAVIAAITEVMSAARNQAAH